MTRPPRVAGAWFTAGTPSGWRYVAGCEPATMGTGPVLTEAFAVQVLAVLAGWGWDEPASSTSPGPAFPWAIGSAPPGRGCSPPAWASCGAAKGRYLLETMCVGGGQGVAAVFEAA